MLIISEFDLKKISYLLNASLNMVDKDHGSALVLLRKTLEKTIHTYYDTLKIEKPVNEEGYSVLSQLSKQLHEQKIINDYVFDSSEMVRRLGNKAAHYSNIEFERSDVGDAVVNVCIVINDMLYKFNAVNNSLFLLSLIRGEVKREHPANESWTNNVRLISELLSEKFILKKVYKNQLNRILNSGFLLDNELYDYIMEIKKIKNGLAVFSRKFSEKEYEEEYTIEFSLRKKIPFFERVFKRFFIDLSLADSAKRIALKEKYRL